jgi:nucleoid-associated protein YgaU
MGQLERYGLYVLCVVIVLILGVAVWGGDAVLPDSQPPAQQMNGPAAVESANAGRAQSEHTSPLLNQLSGITPLERDRSDIFRVKPAETGFAGVSKAAQPETASSKRGQSTPAELASLDKEQKAPRALRNYTVKPGDTIEGIAEKVLGSKKYVDEIKRLNPNVNPTKMRVNQVIDLPWIDAESPPAATAAEKGKWREYTVKSGDNATTISLAMYKSAKYANKILEANKITDPGKLRPKMVLKIPPIED